MIGIMVQCCIGWTFFHTSILHTGIGLYYYLDDHKHVELIKYLRVVIYLYLFIYQQYNLYKETSLSY